MTKPTKSKPKKSSSSKRKGSTKTITLITIVALVLGLSAGWAIAAATTSNGDQGDVWVVQAQTASVSTAAVTMDDVGGALLQVTAGDGNEVTSVSISQLVQGWGSEFGDTQPRAVITGVVDGSTHSLIVNLGTPTATATSITFEGSSIVGGDVPAGDLTAATLLIDNNGLVEAKIKGMDAS